MFSQRKGASVDQLSSVFHWFSGGATQYHNLRMCMQGDTPWIALTVSLDVLVGAGYAVIAYHWWKNQRTLAAGPARRALGNMRNIFVFCGMCGYLFIPLKMVWPAWRLYDLALVGLVYYTWRYALSTRELRVIYSELERSNRLAEDLRKSQEESQRKGFFLNAISHDLRTPLNAVSLQAQLLEMRIKSGESESLGEVVESIHANARAAADLLNALLDYSRLNQNPEKNHLEDLSVAKTLQECAASFKVSAAAKNIDVRVRCAENLRMRSDKMKLDRVFKNLMCNAVKFTTQGSIELTAARTNDGTVEISVCDTGIGIARENQERLFDDFYQVGNSERDRKKGFGLGLSIAQQLARQLGGEITCDSALGKGSRFIVRLPTAAFEQRGAGGAEPEPGWSGQLAVQG
jgi:signal transduction histidine kinase